MLNGPSGIRHSSLPSPLNAIKPKSWKNANTLVPSVTGDGDAGPLTFSRRPLVLRGTSQRHCSFPVARSSARTTSFSPSMPVMKICVRVRTGEECPAGVAVFHTTFFAGPKFDGSPLTLAIPVPFGPRNRDQSGSEATSARANRTEYLIMIPRLCYLPTAHRNFVVRKYRRPPDTAGELRV